MEHLKFSLTETGFHIEGFPEAAKLIEVRQGKHARRLADLAAHMADLQLADDLLDAINRIPQEDALVRRGLWQSAIVSFCKCFGGSKARGTLTRVEVYGDGMENSKQVFDYFMDLRDKHVAHDENAFFQSIPIAVINKPGVRPKVAHVACTSALFETLDQSHWSNMKTLVTRAKSYVEEQIDVVCPKVAAALEQDSYASLIGREKHEIVAPRPIDVRAPRRRIRE